jgi:ketosteroid isomerase-like protein
MESSQLASAALGGAYTREQLPALEAIKALTHRYALALDAFDVDATVAAFTPDAVFDCSAFGLPRLEGHEDLRAFFDHNLQAMANQMHLFANHIIEFDAPDRARGTNYLIQDGYTKQGDRIQCLGLNRDLYVRASGGWLIAERTITPLVPPQLAGY